MATTFATIDPAIIALVCATSSTFVSSMQAVVDRNSWASQTITSSGGLFINCFAQTTVSPQSEYQTNAERTVRRLRKCWRVITARMKALAAGVRQRFRGGLGLRWVEVLRGVIALVGCLTCRTYNSSHVRQPGRSFDCINWRIASNAIVRLVMLDAGRCAPSQCGRLGKSQTWCAANSGSEQFEMNPGTPSHGK
jgi:hypothetical protein